MQKTQVCYTVDENRQLRDLPGERKLYRSSFCRDFQMPQTSSYEYKSKKEKKNYIKEIAAVAYLYNVDGLHYSTDLATKLN